MKYLLLFSLFAVALATYGHRRGEIPEVIKDMIEVVDTINDPETDLETSKLLQQLLLKAIGVNPEIIVGPLLDLEALDVDDDDDYESMQFDIPDGDEVSDLVAPEPVDIVESAPDVPEPPVLQVPEPVIQPEPEVVRAED